MNVKELFDKYYSRLAREGMFKALFCGLAIGFTANFIVAFLCWYFGGNGLLWSLLTLVVVTAATVPIFYFKRFRPNVKDVAKRLDRLGLEERMITMTEFQADESYIAQRQREDAHNVLHSMDTKQIRFKFPRAMIITFAAIGVLGIGMTTVSGLGKAGVISSGKEVIDNILPEKPAVYITITYGVSGGEGLIEGDDVQIIEVGENTTQVVAVADDGYAFLEWSDGLKDPVRYDLNLTEDTVIEATFVPLGDGGEDGMDGDGDEDMEGEGGQGDEPGKSDKPSEEEGEPNLGANGAYEANNMVKDGNTPYRDLLESGIYYEEAIKWLESAENIPQELREFIQMYFGILV